MYQEGPDKISTPSAKIGGRGGSLTKIFFEFAKIFFNFKKKNGYFKVFLHDVQDETPQFRRLLYAVTSRDFTA